MIAAGRSGLAPLSEVQPSCEPHLQYDVVPMIRECRIVEIKIAQYFNRRGKSVCHYALSPTESQHPPDIVHDGRQIGSPKLKG